MSEVIVALISLCGTALGAFGGVVTSAKLTTYRLSQLEKKVDKYNNFAERIPIVEEKIRVINHRLDDLEHNHE